jgi:hypothetical protein
MGEKGDELRKEADAKDAHAEKDTSQSEQLRQAADQHDQAEATEKDAKDK